MKNTNRIRIYFFTIALTAAASYYIGYQYTIGLESEQEYLADANNSMDTEQLSSENTTESDEALASSNIKIPYEYVMVAEDGYLTVYMSDLQTVYLYTDIKLDDLSDELQSEIAKGKFFTDIEELYDFLENYSS